MTDVTLQDVRKEFDGVVAVKNIDLQIPDGAFVTVVGPSGCGKSTTLRLIAGLEISQKGRYVSGTGSSTASSRRTGTSRWCFRTTRCTRT